MEHTGKYYQPIARVLAEAGFFVSAVNPKLIKDYGNNSLRKVKNDKTDALKIARYTLDNWIELQQYNLMDNLREQLKLMNGSLTFIQSKKTALKNNLISLLDQTYPGVNKFFDSPARADGSQNGLTLPIPIGMWIVYAIYHYLRSQSITKNGVNEKVIIFSLKKQKKFILHRKN